MKHILGRLSILTVALALPLSALACFQLVSVRYDCDACDVTINSLACTDNTQPAGYTFCNSFAKFLPCENDNQCYGEVPLANAGGTCHTSAEATDTIQPSLVSVVVAGLRGLHRETLHLLPPCAQSEGAGEKP